MNQFDYIVDDIYFHQGKQLFKSFLARWGCRKVAVCKNKSSTHLTRYISCLIGSRCVSSLSTSNRVFPSTDSLSQIELICEIFIAASGSQPMQEFGGDWISREHLIPLAVVHRYSSSSPRQKDKRMRVEEKREKAHKQEQTRRKYHWTSPNPSNECKHINSHMMQTLKCCCLLREKFVSLLHSASDSFKTQENMIYSNLNLHTSDKTATAKPNKLAAGALFKRKKNGEKLWRVVEFRRHQIATWRWWNFFMFLSFSWFAMWIIWSIATFPLWWHSQCGEFVFS